MEVRRFASGFMFSEERTFQFPGLLSFVCYIVNRYLEFRWMKHPPTIPLEPLRTVLYDE